MTGAQAGRPPGRARLGWKKKAIAFRLFDRLPAGASLYYLAQRYVTRTIPRDLAEHDGWQIEHARMFARWHTGEVRRASLFEFGAGWDLHSSLVQWCYGIDRQVVVDITRLARAELVNHAIAHLERHPPTGAARTPHQRMREPLERWLRDHYGISYVAPSDARRTPLEDASVDLICTTSVLEHVPPSALSEIMRECHRIAAPGAILSHVVDYTDHYAHADPSIGIFNFLRFSDGEWTRFNPSIHYQNRLRHFEYGALFQACGFETLAETVITESRDVLRDQPLAERFRGMTEQQLLARTGHWVLTRR